MKYVVNKDATKTIDNENFKEKKHPFKKLKPLKTAIVSFLIFTIILGFGYTMGVTILSQTLFPYEANGSLINITLKDGTKRVIGSELIGQSYLKMDNNCNYVLKDNEDNLYVTNSENKYFLDENKNYLLDENELIPMREDITTTVIFQANYMIGRFNQGSPSNSAVTTKIYHETLENRLAALNEIGYNEQYNALHNYDGVPSELLTESGSGVDPEISYDVAMYQADMIANKRNMDIKDVKSIINHNTKDKFLGIFGTKRVNVLLVNLELDGLI